MRWSLFVVIVLVTASSTEAVLSASEAIWEQGNDTTIYAYFRSPVFVLPHPLDSIASLVLNITALPSPNVGGSGTMQGKLLGAYKLFVNGVFVTGL